MQTSIFLAHFVPVDKHRLIKRSLHRALSWVTKHNSFHEFRRGHEGLRMGPRHIPLNAAFMNGTVMGENVWIPMTSILGGQERCGFGWNMFVECLAEGRGVSLPAGSIGAAKCVVAGVGAYARVRKQFRVPIAEFGGIQEGECWKNNRAVAMPFEDLV